MAAYTVHVPAFASGTEAETHPASLDAVFVREAFSWGAFLFGPLWLAWHRLWGMLLVWLAVFYGLAIAAPKILPAGAIVAVALLLEYLLALEGNNLRRAELARHGFRLADVAAGAGRADAERLYFRRTPAAGPRRPPRVKISDAQPPFGPPTGEVVGLFPRPEDAR